MFKLPIGKMEDSLTEVEEIVREELGKMYDDHAGIPYNVKEMIEILKREYEAKGWQRGYEDSWEAKGYE